MDDMDIEDFNDACWDQLHQEERAMREQEMLAADPGYGEFLQHYEQR